MFKLVKNCIKTIEANELSKNILYVAGETDRLTFFTLFLFRVQLAFMLRFLCPSLIVFYIFMFYLMYNLFCSRFKNLGHEGKVMPVFPALGVTFFLAELVKIQFFQAFFMYPEMVMTQDAFLALPLVKAVKFLTTINIINLVLLMVVSICIVTVFSLLQGKPVVDSFSIKKQDIFAGESLGFHLFTFSGKTGRLSYLYASLFFSLIISTVSIVYTLIIGIMVFGVQYGIRGTINLTSSLETYKEVNLMFFALLALLTIWVFFGITLKRLHHLGKSGFYSLLLIPLFFISIFFHPLVIRIVHPVVFSRLDQYFLIFFNLYGASYLGYINLFFHFIYSVFILYLAFGHGTARVMTLEKEGLEGNNETEIR